MFLNDLKYEVINDIIYNGKLIFGQNERINIYKEINFIINVKYSNLKIYTN